MILKALFFVCMSLTIFESTQSKCLVCEHKFMSFGTLGIVYGCNVLNDIYISSPNKSEVSIDTEEVQPVIYKVVVISIYGKVNLRYFPRGIEKAYENLKGIQIAQSALQEVHQSDLKPFPKLLNLHLQNNQILILEKDLFKFNPNLELINLSYNSIKHVHPNVFDDLTNLKNLDLHHNENIDMSAENNRTAVKIVIEAAKENCKLHFYSYLEQNINKLEFELKYFKKRLEYLEHEMNDSSFINFFRERLETLKTVQTEMVVPEIITQTPQLPQFKDLSFVDIEEVHPEIKEELIELIEKSFNKEKESLADYMKAFSRIPIKTSERNN